MRLRWWLAVPLAGATAFTLLASVTSVVRFAYRSPALHVSVETAAAIISLIAAQLIYGRFRRSLDRRDLLLTTALMIFAANNLLFSAIPAAADLGSDRFETWTRTIAAALSSAVLASAAFVRPRPVRRPGLAIRRAAALGALALLVIAAAVALAGDWLPHAIAPDLSPEGSSRPRVVGEPVVLGVQLVMMALFAAAAAGFARRAQNTGDRLTLWLAIGATLAAFSRLNYFLFPSLYSEYFYTGDVLRLGFFVAVLIGGAYEISAAQRDVERAAIADERRRLAREIHDGMAQDLAFIVQQADALADGDGDSAAAAEIATAARRALDDSRGAISALVRPTDEPLEQALTRVAQEAARRWGSTVRADLPAGVEVPGPTREALMRIVGEAVTNAARHGRAQTVQLCLRAEPDLRLSIEDDGAGFDLRALAEAGGRHGIPGMRERAENLGGELRIGSQVGEGTQIVVMLP